MNGGDSQAREPTKKHLSVVKLGEVKGNMAIHNTHEALVEALVLALTAPTEEQSKRASALADEFAAGLSEKQVEDAKRTAKVRARLLTAAGN